MYNGEVMGQSIEELESILNTIQEGICVIDKDLIIKNFNDAFARNTEIPRERIIGKKCYEVLHNYSYQDYQKHCIDGCIVNQAFEKNTAVESVHKHIQKNSTPKYHKSKALPIKGGDQVVYIINDVTKRRSLEREIKESEEKYRGLVNNSVVGVYQTTMDGNIITSNPKLVEIFGFSSEDELKQAKPENLYKDEKRRKELLRNLEVNGEVNNFELEARRKDGKSVILNISARVYGNQEGKSKYIEGIIHDVTEQKRLERRLKDYTSQLEHSNKFKDLFTDILRHDLLNPLNVIQNLAELMNDTDDFYEIHKESKMIRKNVAKLQEMIDTAAMLAKVESTDKLNFKRQELGRIIAEAIENVEVFAREKDIRIENKIKGQHIAYVSLFIEAVFSNLLTNAIKYSPNNSKVVVKIENNNEFWKVIVKDYGEGVPDEYKESIFSRFTRMEKKGVKGSGLGLAIVKRILDLHDGRVWVEDNPKKGSIFCVDIPKEPTTEKRLGKDYFIELVEVD